MKDEYTFDLSDFAKYGLLRALAGSGSDRAFRLGVVWYLTPDVGGKDGRRIQYLSEPRPNHYSRADPHLYRRMRQVVCEPGRAVRHVQAGGILPARTAFYPERLAFPGFSPRMVAERLRHRDAWLEGAVCATARCDLVFLDPDNGLAPPTVDRHTTTGTRYAYLDELRAFVELGKAVVVIQFLGRGMAHADQLRDRLQDVQRAMPVGTPPPLALYWRHRMSLAFLIIPASTGQAETLESRAQRMLASLWCQFWGPLVTPLSRKSRRRPTRRPHQLQDHLTP